MGPRLLLSCTVLGIALCSTSTMAACGGGGYTAPREARVVRNGEDEAISESRKRQEQRDSKLRDLQRDIDKAQAKLNNCEGDCEKERRKLGEAMAKYAKKMNEN